MKHQNAFTAKPDLSEWMRKADKSAKQSITESSEAKKASRVPLVFGPRRFWQIKELK